jgi:acid phosphatase (class A)
MKKITALVLFSVILSSSVFAHEQEHRFLGYRLSAPPAEGTSAYDQDFLKLHEYQDHRTTEECAAAGEQSHLNLKNGFGDLLTSKEMRQAKILSMRVIAKTAIAVFYYKQKFKRPRPFLTDETLTPCIQKPSAGDQAYPSGHSATGYALALALAKKFPAKKDVLLERGLKIGENRLIGGVHHPSDVVAGRKLAEQVVKKMCFTRAKTK